MKLRALTRDEIHDLWSIDRRETIEAMYRVEGGELVRRRERHDVRGWPPGEPERDERILLDCFDHGGWLLGAFEGEWLVGVAVLESRFIGRERDTLPWARARDRCALMVRARAARLQGETGTRF